MPLTFPTNPADGDTHEYLGQTYKYAVSDDAWRRVHSEYQVISHNHDERYYLESEVDAFLAGKSNTSHTHSYLPLSGGTLTGPLTLPGSPTAAQQAATKNYVDTEITSAISGISGGGGSTGATAGSSATGTTTVNTGVPNARYFATATYSSMVYLVGSTNASGQFTHTPPPSNGNSYTIFWVVVS